MGDLMNGLLRQRMVGLAVLLALVFLLSLLLPNAPKPDPSAPSTTVSVSGEQLLTEADAVPPPDDMLPEPVADQLPPAEPSVAIADVEASTAPDAAPAAPLPASVDTAGVSPDGVRQPPKRAALRSQDTVEPKPQAKLHDKPHDKPKSPVAAAALPTQPKPKPVEPKSVPTAAGWYVQVGSFSDAGSAQSIVMELKRIGISATVTRITGVKGNRLNRVRAGPYASEAAAKSAQAKIAKNGYAQARIVQEPSPHQ